MDWRSGFCAERVLGSVVVNWAADRNRASRAKIILIMGVGYIGGFQCPRVRHALAEEPEP